MRFCFTLLTIAAALLFSVESSGQSSYWTSIANGFGSDVFQQHYKPAVYRAYHLNEQQIRSAVANAALEGSVDIEQAGVIVMIPNPGGTLESYRVVESQMMEAGLAEKFPMIKTYIGTGIDHRGSVLRFDLSPNGFHAVVLSPDRPTFYINAVNKAGGHYIVFDRTGLSEVLDPFECNTDALLHKEEAAITQNANDGLRRTYRLAVTVNGEYSQSCLNGTEPDDAARKAKVLAMLTTNLNRLNGIYDRDFGMRLIFVANMEDLLFLDAATDPFSTTQSSWNTTTRTTLTNFGNANFDVGHMVGKGSPGGNAGCIGCVCGNGTSNSSHKGSAYTAHNLIQGDPLVVDYWAHELGHQFGANHTFSHSTEGSGSNMEPGSGSTIMGYAGITGSTDVQSNSDDYFHARSIEQVSNAYRNSTPSGCATLTPTGNIVPLVNSGGNFTIPRSTPFMLTAQGSDGNAGDVLSYTWEQYNNFASGSNTIPNANSTSGPVFRSRTYSTSPVRTFPMLSSILNGSNGNTWEVLPGVNRTLNFRVTVRDNSILGGANHQANMVLTIDASTGPFAVTAPNTNIIWRVGEFQNVTWNVAGTTGGNVNCANVTIEMSVDGGNTFPITLASSTPNDGSQEVVVPNQLTNTARIRVRALGNIFFDISNANFSVQQPPAADFVFNNPEIARACEGSSVSTILSTSGLAGYTTPINLTASGVPANAMVVFSNNAVTPGNSVTVTLMNQPGFSLPVGTHVITVTGVSGSITKSRNITFVVSPSTGGPALNSPANGSNNQALLPTLTWAAWTGAERYRVDVSTSAAFTSPITTNNITATSHTLTTSLTANTQYFWRVTASTACGEMVSGTFSFMTAPVSCSTFVSTDVPIAISASGTPTIQSTLGVGISGTITDVDVVGLQGTHTYIQDLTVRLISPTGTTVTLFDQICSSQDNFDLNLDDAAASGTFPCPPVGGITRRPQQPLAAFNGQNMLGWWTLSIRDNVNLDGGSLNGWGLMFCVSGSVLPVSWLNFTATRNGENAVLVQWSTSAEVNNKFFEVQRSRDGINFEVIGTVNAGSAPSGVQQYFFNDLKPSGGINYYRLKQVDNDGRSALSSIVKVVMPDARIAFSIRPNPASDQAVLLAQTAMKQTTIRMMDVSGKTVYSTQRSQISAGERLVLPVGSLAKGYYLVIIESDNQRFTEKLVVQ